MAVDQTTERQNYIIWMQSVCAQVLALNQSLVNLNNLYVGGGLSGTFLDADCAASAGTKHLSAALVATYTSNLQTIAAAITAAIQQNMANATGNRI